MEAVIRLKEMELESQKMALKKDELMHVLEMKRLEEEIKRAEEETKRAEIRLREKELDASRVSSREREFDMSKNICLVPPFSEKDVDKYFTVFERVALSLKWPRDVWTLLLPCG